MGAVDLPADLRAVLARLHQLEATAAGHTGRHRRVCMATGRVMLAAFEAGWPVAWLAEALGISHVAASGRVQRAAAPCV